jgi:hypothetical protein
MFDRVTAAAREMETALTELDADTLIGSQPAEGLAVLARHERCVAAARLALTARAEEMRQWHRDGYRSFDEWMAATFGTSPGAAKKRARTAKNLSDRDRTAKALADGEISEDEADVVADAAAQNPDAEDELLDTAKNNNKSHDDLKDKAADAKARGEGDRARARRLRRGRRAGWGTDREGFWTLSGRFEPHVGAQIKSCLQAEVDRVCAITRRGGAREPFDRYRADAIANLIAGLDPTATTATTTADNTTATGNGTRTKTNNNNNNGHNNNGHSGGTGSGTSTKNGAGNGDDTDSNTQTTAATGDHPQLDLGLDPRPSDPANPDPAEPDHGGAPRRSPDPTDTSGDRPDHRAPGPAGTPAGSGRVGKELVIDINLQTYRRGTVLAGETCTIRGVGPVPVEIAHQWADDAFIKAVIRDGTDVRTVAHYGRHVPAHVKTALGVLDTKCAVPGCSNPRVELDHDTPFADGGACSTTNLRPLCAHHHRQRTHHDYELTGPPHNRQWTDPTGRVLFTDQPTRAP